MVCQSVDFVGIYVIGNKKTKCQLNVFNPVVTGSILAMECLFFSFFLVLFFDHIYVYLACKGLSKKSTSKLVSHQLTVLKPIR